jgi:hypothetical protein
MYKQNERVKVFSILSVALLLTGFAASSLSPVTSSFALATTLTPTPASDLVMPGYYYIGRCTDKDIDNGVKIKFCVNNIRVDSLRHMFYEVSWTATNLARVGGHLSKQTDKYNDELYLVDNLGNHYDHAAGGGAAYRTLAFEEGIPQTGWFEFGSPPLGALSFDFHDDHNRMEIKGIKPIPGYGYISYDTLPLDQYPLVLEYDKDKWTPTKNQDGTNMLTHKTMPACTIQPKQPAEPKGKLKSQTKVGNIIYTIYGYFDENLNLYVREYVYVSGIPGLDPSIKPFFYVTIPARNSNDCIIAASNVLARLKAPSP